MSTKCGKINFMKRKVLETKINISSRKALATVPP